MDKFSENELIKLACSLYTTDEILEKSVENIETDVKKALQMLGDAGLKGAEACKRLGIALNKYKEKQNEKTDNGCKCKG